MNLEIHEDVIEQKDKQTNPEFQQTPYKYPPDPETDQELKELEKELWISNPYKEDVQRFIERNYILQWRGEEQEYYRNATKVLSEQWLDHLYQKTDFQWPDVILFPIIDKEKNEFSIAYMSLLFCWKTRTYPLENGKIPENISFGLWPIGDERLKLEWNTKDNILTKPHDISHAEKEAQKWWFQWFLNMWIKYVLWSLFWVNTPIGFNENIKDQTIDTRQWKDFSEIKKHIQKIEYDLKHATYSVDRMIKLTFEKSILEDFIKEKEWKSINPINELQSRAEIWDLIFIDKDESDFSFQWKLWERALSETWSLKWFSHVVMVTGTDPFEFSHATMSGPNWKSWVYREDFNTYWSKYKFDAMLVKTNISSNQRSKIIDECKKHEWISKYDKKSAITEFTFWKNMWSDAVNCSEYVWEILSSIDPSFVDANNKAIPNRLLESQHLFTPSYTTTVK